MRGHPTAARAHTGEAPRDGALASDWLLRRRVTIPDGPPDLYVRPALAARCVAADRHATLLVAPAGFGKTTLLAEGCRGARDRGSGVAWLVLDGRDSPDVLDTCIAHAFQAAGLDVFDAGPSSGAAPYRRTAQALGAVAAREMPVVLALDEAEQLADPRLVAVINFVLQSRPPNLHVAIACRELPRGIDVASGELGLQGEILTADDLRFTREDIAGFFGHELSRRELARVAASSQGWPIALRLRLAERRLGRTSRARVVRDMMCQWIDSRLWSALDDDDAEFLLDVGVLDWIDAELLDEVLEQAGATRRLLDNAAFFGLLEPARLHGAKVWRLHPLVRDYCARRRLRDHPGRYRTLHRRAAAALARRGRLIAALRHAHQAEDADVAANMLLSAGGVRLGLSDGTDQLVAANDLLPETAVSAHPRLALLRCVALAASGRVPDARRLYATVPADPADVDLVADRCFTRAAITDFGCESSLAADVEESIGELLRFAQTPELDPVARAASEFAVGVLHNIAGQPQAAMRRCKRVQRLLAKRYPMSTPTVALQSGLAAMALGRAAEARRWYAKSLELANSGFVARPGLVRGINVLVHELELERARLNGATAPPPAAGDVGHGAQWHVSLASADLAVEHARATAGTDAALAVVDTLTAPAERTSRTALVRHLAAQRVSLLADAGRVDAAEAAWNAAALPSGNRACVDLARQGWREAESLSCARLRLLAAQRAFEPARRLGETVLKMATARGLARTVMRTRALCLRIEYLAGAEQPALAQLEAYVAALADADYARPLVREEAAAEVLGRLAATCTNAAQRRTVQSLLVSLEKAARADVPSLSVRERDVLRRLGTDRDDDIAAALGISRHGVRYHVGNILRKLGVRTRREAARRARESGILPGGPSPDSSPM